MCITNNEIFQASVAILEKAKKHQTLGHRSFLTAYQIWFELERNKPGVAQRIKKKVGCGVGVGAGSHQGPAQKVAQVLSKHHQQLEVAYIDTRMIRFEPNKGNIKKPSYKYCDLFRLR